MSTEENKADKMTAKYSQKANEAMDKVTDDQNENIKEKVKAVRDAALGDDPEKKVVE